jgi:4-hydroxy-tetrahydrodipicolinate synthase
MAMNGPFSGIYPMMYAFFRSDGSLDREAMRRQVRACVRRGAHGIAVLGLATEVGKLSPGERRQLVAWVAEDADGAVPIAVTVSEAEAKGQVEFANWAQGQGASWVILQPPPQRGMPESWYADFFAAVMQGIRLPCAIQNAPEYIGVGLSPESVASLRDRCPNFTLLKGEGPVLAVRSVIEAVRGGLAVFNGRGGLELPDNLRAGCAGMIPATDTFDYQVRIFDLMRASQRDEREAEEIYEKILPAIVYTLQSLDTLICYGKRIAALRLGLPEVHDRAPALAPTEFGMACARRYADMLGPLV